MKTIRFSMAAFFALCLASSAMFAQSTDANKETVRKIMAAVDAGDAETMVRYLSPDFKEHQLPPGDEFEGMSDIEVVKMMIPVYHAAFPDSKTDIQFMVAEGDKVVVYSEWSGTNKGEMMGMPATNKFVKINQVDIVRFDASGKAAEHWALMDEMAMMQQLGMMDK